MQIFAKGDGNTITLDVDPNDTIDGVKAQIEDKRGIPINRLDLRLSGTVLLDGRTLDNYGIVKETWIDYIILNNIETATTQVRIENNDKDIVYSHDLSHALVGHAKYVKLYEGLDAIPEVKFYNVASLQTIQFPSSLIQFGSGYIDTVLDDVREYVELFIAGTWTLHGSSTTSLLDYIYNNLRIMHSDGSTFGNCTSLTEIDLSMTKLTSISSFSFCNCIALKTVVLPISVVALGARTFQDCALLEDINLENVLYFFPDAFLYCTSLTEITLSSNIIFIHRDTFSNCDNLTTIYTDDVAKLRNLFDSFEVAIPDTCQIVKSPIVVSGTCFPGETLITTDQGPIEIQHVDCAKHTIRGKTIVAVTKTVLNEDFLVQFDVDALYPGVPDKPTVMSPNHAVYYKGAMIKARDFTHFLLESNGSRRIENAQRCNYIPYDGAILYNILLNAHDKMAVNGMIVETMHPDNVVSKLYQANWRERNKYLMS